MIVEEEIGQMSLQVEKLEGNMAKLTIEATAEEFEKAIEKAYQKNKNKLSIPGFRKGKVPRKMIEQMYGKEIFFEDAQRRLCHSRRLTLYRQKQESRLSSPLRLRSSRR